jgi:hypothetical protein
VSSGSGLSWQWRGRRCVDARHGTRLRCLQVAMAPAPLRSGRGQRSRGSEGYRRLRQAGIMRRRDASSTTTPATWTGYPVTRTGSSSTPTATRVPATSSCTGSPVGPSREARPGAGGGRPSTARSAGSANWRRGLARGYGGSCSPAGSTCSSGRTRQRGNGMNT